MRTRFLKLFLMLMFTITFGFCETKAAGFIQSGEYYHYIFDDGSIAYNQIIEQGFNKYYVNDTGNVVFNSWILIDGNHYYAGNEGILYRNGKFKILDNYYHFNSEGQMETGWIDNTYYASPEDGYLLNGFQALDIPKDWYTEYDKETTGWFYFDTNTYKKVCSNDDTYMVKTIGNNRYCFDQNGIMRTGWRQVKDTTPVMKGYMYFVEEETSELKYGQAVCESWYAVEPPAEVVPNGNVRYFHFNGQGVPRTAPTGGYQKVRIGEKTFLFNEYGYAVYGLKKVGSDFYYFGDSIRDCSMKTGIINKDLENNGETGNSFYFEDTGVGFTGVYNNKLYYKGKLQKSTSDEKYAAFQIDNLARLVNSKGVIMKNKNKAKDGDGCVWSTNSGGVVTYTDEGVIQKPIEAEENTDD